MLNDKRGEIKVRKELIDQLLESDNLPDDDLTIDKIVERAHDFTKYGSEISFLIERHPGYGRRTSHGRGVGLSAFWSEKTKYSFCLDSQRWKIEVLESTFEYDAWLMANEEVDSLKEGGYLLPSRVKDKKEKENIIKEALKLMQKCYRETRDDYISDEDFNKMLESVLDEMSKILREDIEVSN